MSCIVFVTDLTLWSMGAACGGPAFTKTIEKYMHEGCNLYLISDEPDNEGYPLLDSEHNIVINRSFLYSLISKRFIGFIFRWINHKLITKKYCEEIEKIVKHEKVDCLYAYEIFGVKACKKMSLKYGIPLVTRFQGTILSQYPNTFLYRLRLYPHHQALKEEANLVVMTNDGTQGDKVLDSLKNKSPRMFAYNGLDLLSEETQKAVLHMNTEELRDGLGIKKNETMFLTVSRLETWKKVNRAIEGFAQFIQLGGDGKLVIVGDGEEKERLQSLSKEVNLADRIIFMGAIKHEMVYHYMKACDVFLSLYDLSNVGNPLLEAMAMGKPLITLDVGDTKRVISNEFNGVLISYDEIKYLGKKMLDLSEDSERRYEIGNRAVEWIQNNLCSWEKRMEKEYSMVQNVMNK